MKYPMNSRSQDAFVDGLGILLAFIAIGSTVFCWTFMITTSLVYASQPEMVQMSESASRILEFEKSLFFADSGTPTLFPE